MKNGAILSAKWWSNSLTLDLTLARNSIDNPLYTRMGSQFTFNVSLTPPFSLWDGKDYKGMERDEGGYENPENINGLNTINGNLK